MIRTAELRDIPRLLVLGRQFHAESRYADLGLEFDPLVLRDNFESLIDESNPDAGVFVAERSEEIVGMACVIRSRPFMSRARVAAELFWWIRPEYRGTVDAVRLMLALERWAKESGCTVMTMMDLLPIESSPAAAIYTRLGYTPVERSWIKKV